MPIPNADKAVVPPAKIAGYLLNLSHPVGGPKARWLVSIGYDSGQPGRLADDLRTLVQSSEQVVAETTPFGIKYRVKGVLTSPTGQVGNVVTVGSSSPECPIPAW